MENNKNKLSVGFRKFAENVEKNTQIAVKKVSDTVKQNGEKLGDTLSKFQDEQDRKRLNPIFIEDIEKVDFVFPAIIQVIDYDKRLENRVCKGSIGFDTRVNATRILTVYLQYLPMLNIRLYPQPAVGVYYVNPCYHDLYIDINEFFSYMKQVRVDELEKVAHQLGARHFKVTLNVQDHAENQKSASASGRSSGSSADSSYETNSHNVANINVAADIRFSGSNDPVMPELVYFKDDTDIASLISMRMNSSSANQIHSKTYSIKYGKSLGIQIEQKTDIQAALKLIHCKAAESFTQTLVKENNTMLEYYIEF